MFANKKRKNTAIQLSKKKYDSKCPTISIRVYHDEKEALKTAAVKAKVSLSEYVRKLLEEVLNQKENNNKRRDYDSLRRKYTSLYNKNQKEKGKQNKLKVDIRNLKQELNDKKLTSDRCKEHIRRNYAFVINAEGQFYVLSIEDYQLYINNREEFLSKFDLFDNSYKIVCPDNESSVNKEVWMSYKLIDHRPDENEDDNEIETDSQFIDTYYDEETEEIDCPRCGSPVLSSFNYCPNCREEISE